MPKEYLYCAQCQTRLSNDDFHRCFEIRGRLVCDGCVTEAMAPLSLKEQEEILIMIREARDNPPPAPRPEPLRIVTGRTSQKLAAVRAPLATRPVSESALPRLSVMPAPQPQRSSSAGAIVTILLLLMGAGVALFVFVNQAEPIVVATVHRKAEAPKPPPPPPPPPRKKETPADPLQRARLFTQNNPDDLSGQAAEWQKAVAASEKTPFAEAARREWEVTQKSHAVRIEAQLAALDKEVAPLVQKEEFRKALTTLDIARARHTLVDWTTGVDVRTKDLNASTWKLFQPLRDQAMSAKAKNATAEVAAAQQRVAAWGLDRFVIELDLALAINRSESPAPTPANPTPAAPESRGVRAVWEKAIEPATSRQYAAAIKNLGASAELKPDLELLKAAQVAEAETRTMLSGWPKGQRVALELLTETYDVEKVNEPFVRATESGIEILRGGAATAVEFDDIAARSLAEIWMSKPGADRKIAALLCLLEGDAAGARLRLGDQTQDVVPLKYWERAAKVQEARAMPAEVSARRLWFAAERENAAGKTRAAAVAKYRALLNDHAASEFVKGRRDKIVKRRDAGREYAFTADDLTGAGSLKYSRHPKPGICWISMSDSAAAAGPNNYVEFQFYALPDVGYRCWVFVGGCCQETLEFYCQSTDLTVPDPQTKAPIQAEPGGAAVAPVKHSIPFLKSKHEMHGGPKEAKRWEWIALTLPKYTAGGVKVVRLITDQKGFGAAFAVVSATRNTPPGESEMKSLIKVESAAEEPVAAVVGEAPPAEKDPALVGHWKFDDATGATAVDASGADNTAILAGGATGGPGRLGGALKLDGKDAHAAIPNSPALDKLQDGSYTIAAWFKPASRPAKDAYGIVLKTGLHEGLKYGADMKFSMDHWLGENTSASAASGVSFSPGAWYHVVGVVSRAEAAVRVYVNGKPEGALMWGNNLAPRPFGNATWKIGIGAPGAAENRWAADGEIDDVRLYSRALNAAEIRALAGGVVAAVAPSVAITSPGPGETYEAGATIPLQASVTGLEKLSKVDFLLGSTVVGSDASAPYSANWVKVPSGIYTLVARATPLDKGAPVFSRPLTVRVGDVQLHRAINFGSSSPTAVDGVTYEAGNGARDLSINGEKLARKDLELQPAVDASRAALLKSSISYRDGVVATLLKVPNGAYQVYAYVWEDKETTVFDVLLEDKVVQSRVSSGPPGTWARLGPWTVDVQDGSLKLAVKGGPVNFAAIEAWKVSR